ncbi:MAG: phage late control D family protein [Gammaproteobacteria bacterium]|nr:phage late control D family protein [Gammaproteobacteria bacterium]
MTPTIVLRADGSDITARVRAHHKSLKIVDEAGHQSDTLTLTLDDRDGMIELPRRSATLSVSLGYRERGLNDMGAFVVDELELSGPPAQIVIKAKAADMRARIKAPRTRLWPPTTLGAIVHTIAAEHGLVARVGRELRDIALPHIDQTEESALHLLTRLSHQHDAVAKPASGHLLFIPKGTAHSASGQTLPILAIHRSDAIDYRVTLAERGQYGAVRASWHDVQSGTRTAVTIGDGEPVYTLRHPHTSPAAARAAARAKLTTLTRGTATLDIQIDGTSAVAAEIRLRLSGFRDGIDGEWITTRVTHAISDAGYTTNIEPETPT